ncbi:hypothetical protein [Janibacter sp. GXQ6167]|uniref:hypothetical protein n=1 Tax=Janibacter sp. GXQ6167 TaxID=3240791 RepID=UPI003524DB96
MASRRGLIAGIVLLILGAIAWIVGEVALSDPNVVGANIGAGILILAGQAVIVIGVLVIVVSLLLRLLKPKAAPSSHPR